MKHSCLLGLSFVPAIYELKEQRQFGVNGYEPPALVFCTQEDTFKTFDEIMHASKPYSPLRFKVNNANQLKIL